MTDVKTITKLDELEVAYKGSWYTISGAGGELNDWVTGYEEWMLDRVGAVPEEWFQTTGAAINLFAGDTGDPYPLDVVVLLFPLKGLEMGKLAMFKLGMQDRWFDDVIDNMRRR